MLRLVGVHVAELHKQSNVQMRQVLRICACFGVGVSANLKLRFLIFPSREDPAQVDE